MKATCRMCVWILLSGFGKIPAESLLDRANSFTHLSACYSDGASHCKTWIKIDHYFDGKFNGKREKEISLLLV